MARAPRPTAQIAIGVALMLVCATVGFTLFRSEDGLRAGRRNAAGTVVGNVERGAEYRPVIRFTDERGRERTATAATGRAEPLYDPGTRVAILYDPSAPGEVRVDSNLGRYGLPVLFAVLTVFLGAVFVVRPLLRRHRPAAV